jgi:hypothetical protein
MSVKFRFTSVYRPQATRQHIDTPEKVTVWGEGGMGDTIMQGIQEKTA